MRTHIAVLAFVASIACASPTQVWAQVARRSEAADARADARSLIADVNTVIRAQRAVEEAWQSTNGSPEEHARRLFGIGADASPSEAASRADDWWRRRFMDPLVRIAGNPAASCDLAQRMHLRVVGLGYQAQGFGVADPASRPEAAEAIHILKLRCLADAFNECMQTGNAASLIAWAEQWSSEMGPTLGMDETIVPQATYLLRRCAVYELVYHLETTGPVFPASSEIDGSVTLFFTPEFFAPGLGPEDSAVRLRDTGWVAPAVDGDAPNVRLTNIDCGRLFLACGPDATPRAGGRTRGMVAMRRTALEQTVEEGEQGARQSVRIRTERAVEDEDFVELYFAPPLLAVRTVARDRSGETVSQELDAGPTIFYSLHRESNGMVHLTSWVRQGHPVLFRLDLSGSEPLVGTSRASLELRHRPELFPAAEIRPEWEQFSSGAAGRMAPTR